MGPVVVGADLTRITAASSNVGALVVSGAWAGHGNRHTAAPTGAAGTSCPRVLVFLRQPPLRITPAPN